MNLNGRYNIYKNNELIYQSPNLITENGKSIILQYLAGNIVDWASLLAIGAFNNAATTSDYKLDYEIMRLDVDPPVAVDSVTTLVTGSGTINTSSVIVSSSTSLSVGQSISGGGIASSVVPTITSISGNNVFISHPVQSTFSGSTLTFKTVKSIKFKSRIGTGNAFRIYELGMFNNSRALNATALDAKIISNFDEGVEFNGWSAGTSASVSNDSASYYPRVGSSMLKITPYTSNPASAVLFDTSFPATAIGASTSTVGQLSIDTLNFSASYDNAKLLIHSSASGASVTVIAQDNTTGLTTNTITLIPKTLITASGPSIIQASVVKGSTYNDTLSKVQISASVSSGSVDLYFDSLKLSKIEELSIYKGMVSRSVLPTPISKTVEETVDIEYELFLFP